MTSREEGRKARAAEPWPEINAILRVLMCSKMLLEYFPEKMPTDIIHNICVWPS